MRLPLTVLAALVVAAVALGAAGCGGDSETVTQTEVSTVTKSTTTDTDVTTATETQPTDTTSTKTTTDVAPPPSSLSVFRSPTGNIGCQMSARTVRCDVRQHDFAEPQTPSDCPLDYGDSLAVDLSGSGYFVCHGDTAVDPSSPSLSYGSSNTVGPFTCKSEESAMTCTNSDSGHGFKLSKQATDVF